MPARERICLALIALLALAASCDRSAPASPSSDSGAAQGCARTSTGFSPLTDLSSGTYQGQSGGLYRNGSNAPPAGHLSAGLALAQQVQPLDALGQPDPNGRFAFISIGMSNTTQEFSAFMPMANADPQKHPRLVVVDGAQGGMTAADWLNPGCSCWAALDNRLRQADIAAAQVTTAWVKLADRQPSTGWPGYAQTLSAETVGVLRMLKTRFSNLALAYLSSRIYAGYATTTLNPEPYAYESGFSVRWAIQEQTSGALPFSGPGAEAPWIAWGPYLWADGLRARSDGLTWACSDLQSDGTHPSATGRQKVAQMLLDFVRTDPTAREWYRQ